MNRQGTLSVLAAAANDLQAEVNIVFYHGEELMDVDAIDRENEEMMAAVRKFVRELLEDAENKLDDAEMRYNGSIKKADAALERTNIDRIEKKKTFLSKILYIIGSIISPELMPVEMFGKQEMPDEKRREFAKRHAEIAKLRGDAENGKKTVREFMPIFAEITRTVLSSDETILNYLKCAIEAYKENDSKGKYYNTVFMMFSLLRAGLMEDERIRYFLRHGVSFPHSKFQEKLAEFNEWFLKTFPNRRK